MHRRRRSAVLVPSSRLPAVALAVVLSLIGLDACTQHEDRSGAVTIQSGGQVAPNGSAPGDAGDGQWVRPGKDLQGTRYAALDQITPHNAAGLKLVLTFSTGVLRGHEEAPIVVGNTMYIVTPFPNYLYALDISKDPTKDGWPTKWVYKPKPLLASQGVACCDVVNRGVSYDNGKLFFNTLDAHTVAVDASTGQELWNTQVGDIDLGESTTMAPLAAKGKVFVGVSGGEFGIRGWLKALDQGSGKVVWTAYHTGPDADVLIGARFRPFYDKDRGRDLGVKTWPGDKWKIGGAGAWGWVTYDPALDLIYYGTANPGPWNPEQRPGDNKWSSTLFARRPDDGEAVWAYQLSPHDLHDYDAINEDILVDLTWKGQPRQVLLRPERNGYVFVMDRRTGEVLSAEPFGYVNTSSGVDLKTGLLQYNPEKEPRVGQVTRYACPASPGMKDWQPSAYSPKTGLLYIPHQNLCQDVQSVEANYIAGTPYVGMNVKMYAGPGDPVGHRGEYLLWDVANARKRCAIPEDFPVWSGTIVTAGNVAFYGTMDGWFKAVDATNCTLLWKFKTGSGIISQPTTFRGPGGKQYVAVVDGVGGWAGAIVAGGLDPRDSSSALGFVNAMKDLPQKTTKGGSLYVFALP